jgi:MFS family permease
MIARSKSRGKSLTVAPAIVRRTFTALKYYNYRLWFIGQLVSLFGTWMQSTAQGFLVFQLTNSPAYLGYVGFAAGLPTWLFTLYGGVIADRISRRKLLLLTQTSMMVLAFVLTALTFSGRVQPWHIIVLAFFLGIANAFDAPARQSFVLEMVEREDLTNAIALNSLMFNTATAIGPAVAGITYALFGPGWCFAINGLSFIAVIIALSLMRLEPMMPAAQRNSVLHDLKEGFRYVAAQNIIRVIILNLGIVSLFGLGFSTLTPAWAVQVLGGDSTTNGYLQSARGFGALVSALMIASLGRFKTKGRLWTVGSFTMPLVLLIFSTTRYLPLSLLVLLCVGWSLMVLMNMSNALVQTQVADHLRGRVMGIYTLTFFGFMPVGSLVNGTLATKIGAPLTLVINASVLLLVAGVIWWRVPKLRQME